MLYRDIVQARFCRRLNRFVAQADLGNGPEPVHVKNTGRCAELLIPGCRAWLQDAGPGTTRKTRYDLIAVEKIRPGREPLLVNLDSAAPNAVAGEWLAGGPVASPCWWRSRAVPWNRTAWPGSLTPLPCGVKNMCGN